jgi:hypothetical protein
MVSRVKMASSSRGYDWGFIAYSSTSAVIGVVSGLLTYALGETGLAWMPYAVSLGGGAFAGGAYSESRKDANKVLPAVFGSIFSTGITFAIDYINEGIESLAAIPGDFFELAAQTYQSVAPNLNLAMSQVANNMLFYQNHLLSKLLVVSPDLIPSIDQMVAQVYQIAHHAVPLLDTAAEILRSYS